MIEKVRISYPKQPRYAERCPTQSRRFASSARFCLNPGGCQALSAGVSPNYRKLTVKFTLPVGLGAKHSCAMEYTPHRHRRA